MSSAPVVMGLRRFVVLVLCWGASLGMAAESVVLGVLSFRPVEMEQIRWAPLEGYLNETAPSILGERHVFKVKAFNLTQLRAAVRDRQVDFVLTQPAEYVRMTQEDGLSSPLATLVTLEQGQAVRGLGGVILTRRDQADINTIDDLEFRRVATLSTASFGAYQAQAHLLKHLGIRLGQVVETGAPQDLAIDALLAGRVDVAFVRSGLIEAMSREGKLKLSDLKIINQQKQGNHPFALSTSLYPEWPVVALAHVSEDMTVFMAGALLSMPHNGDVASKLGIHGFTVPSEYEPVRSVMRELKVPPFDMERDVTLAEIWHQYRVLILSMLGAALVVLTLAVRAAVLSRRLTSITEAMGEGLFVTNAAGLITYVNRAAQLLLGHPRHELLGKPIDKLMVSSEPQGLDLSGEHQFVTRDGRQFPAEVSSRPVYRRGRLRQIVAVFDDISERKHQEAHIFRLAFYDNLTGLPNRRMLTKRLNEETDHFGLLMMLDLDHFNQINDTLGHQIGNALLKSVARRIESAFPSPAELARLGGDEFVVVLPRPSLDVAMDETYIHAHTQHLLDLFNEPFAVDGQLHHLTTSIGVVALGEQALSADELLKRAEIAMYQAKASGRNTWRQFDAGIAAKLAERAVLESDFRHALQAGQFVLHYQLQVNAQGEPLGVEALVRWQHPQRGLVPPGMFIPMAEENGLIVALGQWVLEEACRQIAAWQGEHPQGGLIVAVNVSAHQIFLPDFVSRVAKALQASGANPRLLQIELTESVLATNIEDTIEKMKALSDMGVTFSLDDFGTGYSSLAYLKRLPLNQLKIDASFVRDILSDPNDAVITRTVIALGHSLGLEVIAEGVETAEQRDCLAQQGCDSYQGYYFARPLPVSSLDALWRQPEIA